MLVRGAAASAAVAVIPLGDYKSRAAKKVIRLMRVTTPLATNRLRWRVYILCALFGNGDYNIVLQYHWSYVFR